MRQPGVWADHLQVIKLSTFFKSPVWLIRYDDKQIKQEENGVLFPGQDYRIGDEYMGNNVNPIVLYFIPEAHYEVLKPIRSKTTTKEPLHRQLIELENILKNKEIGSDLYYSIADRLILALFDLENHILSIKNTFQMVENVDMQLRNDLRNNLGFIIDQGKNFNTKFSLLFSNLPKDFVDYLSSTPGCQLHAELLKPIFNEDVRFQNGKLVERKNGPISLIDRKLEHYNSFKNSNTYLSAFFSTGFSTLIEHVNDSSITNIAQELSNSPQ